MGKVLLIIGKVLLIIGVGWLVAGVGWLVAIAPFAYLFNGPLHAGVMKGANPVGTGLAMWLTVALALVWIVFLTKGLSRLIEQP
jgi:hypothetical protein